MGEKFRIGIGTLSLLIGVFLVLDSSSGITGHIISEQTGRGIGSVFGLAFIIGGLLLFFIEGREKSGLEYSVGEAVLQGVPEEEARRILKESNEKVNSGKWVELSTFRVRDTANPEKFPEGTSLCRYWGPSNYKELSGKQLDKLYKKGEIGKTHEVDRGSESYALGGSLIKGTVSIPPKGSRILHRHWEIAQMDEYKQRKSA